MRKHYNAKHLKANAYKCRHCPYTSLRKDHVKSHLKVHHPSVVSEAKRANEARDQNVEENDLESEDE